MPSDTILHWTERGAARHLPLRHPPDAAQHVCQGCFRNRCYQMPVSLFKDVPDGAHGYKHHHSLGHTNAECPRHSLPPTTHPTPPRLNGGNLPCLPLCLPACLPAWRCTCWIDNPGSVAGGTLRRRRLHHHRGTRFIVS
ncbi:hypothetical protein E2C01_008168 [Portunus trituberculatus]|uniref:Uncharacterized protein n=1 Tax=Portunus trituberculatus TaxID=210409 RepID=A0A5B7D1L8_PORTR|nr:hypothetical protein [Portunus trituberculatus]